MYFEPQLNWAASPRGVGGCVLLTDHNSKQTSSALICQKHLQISDGDFPLPVKLQETLLCS